MKNILFFLAILCLTQVLIGQTSYINDKIIVFKDGTVYFEKHTTVDVNNREVVLAPAPFSFHEDPEQARYSRADNIEKRLIMGTLLFTAPKNNITSVCAFDSSSVDLTPDYSMHGLIRANKGQEVTLKLKDKEETVTGEIIDLEIKTGRNYNSVIKRIIIKNNNSLHYIFTEDVEEIRFLQDPSVKAKSSNTTNKAISLEFAKNTEKQRIDISYLQKGLTWMPNYFLDIADDKNAELSLYANLVNDIEDINDVEVNFVVGVPAFYFSYVSSPLASNKDILQILSDLNNPPANSRGGVHPTMAQRGPRYNVSYGTNYEAQVEGGDAEDMFFYKKQNISIRKNASALIPILNTKIEYTDFYTTDLYTNIKDNELVEENSKPNSVWHAIQFKNTTDFPLTTGSVFFNKKNSDSETNLLSQNIIDYTPVNEYSKVKMAITPDIVVRHEEVEKGKKEIDYYYDTYQMEGEITIINYKSKPVEMVVNRLIYGDLKNSSKKWEYQTSYGTSKNKKNNVQWKLTIPAGEMEKISYKYDVIAR